MNTHLLYWSLDERSVMRREVLTRPVMVGLDGCDIALQAKGVASIHAAFERVEQQCRVRRVSATRALKVNGEPCEKKLLEHGDRITVGEATLRYVCDHGRAPRMLRLCFTSECSDTSVEVMVWPSRIVIGRNEGIICVDELSVSGTHLEIEHYGADMCWVRDLDSMTGTTLNGRLLTQRTLLRDGDRCVLGRVSMSVHDGGELPSSLSTFEPRTIRFEGSRMS